ncbi:L-fucose:H+ symporter permease [Alistipes onderdonkii]|jgi:FHS family L-fucose permease-like MFS transporter|uniref:L-fucose:H+ symporter permease n=1 Tax=Alistipes onderdonkii TaxID=328813 RepID=UPI00050A0F2D|nr:L-fucose:H+ symporter permease [Alistipes onderdonkii]
MEKRRVIPKGIAWPFILLTCLFFAWAIPNNLTDTMLAAFKRIMSLSDSRTAWIQVVCYLLGYGCCAIPGAMFIKRYTYKAGVLLGLGLYAFGTFLFYPAMLCSSVNIDFSFIMFLLAIFVLFSGLSVLETSANSYVLMMGDEQTATQRLNFAQSFNPFGAITGVVISQVFILSQLNLLTSSERAALPMDELTAIQGAELNAVTTTYVILGLVMLAIMLAIRLTRMPSLKEAEEKVDFGGTFRRLVKNKNYVWGIVAQFFYVGAQIAVWSFVIRYAMQQLHFDTVVASLASDAPTASVISALRDVEPVAGKFYDLCERIGLDDLLPRTAEQAGATYYILSLILFVTGRFACTGLMRFFKPRNILTALALLATICCFITIYGQGASGVYGLMGISGCMSIMFPTIYGFGLKGLGGDTKIGGAGMVMAIAGAAVLTQVQGIVSDQVGSIKMAYWVPAVAFMVILYYSIAVCRKTEKI